MLSIVTFACTCQFILVFFYPLESVSALNVNDSTILTNFQRIMNQRFYPHNLSGTNMLAYANTLVPNYPLLTYAPIFYFLSLVLFSVYLHWYFMVPKTVGVPPRED